MSDKNMGESNSPVNSPSRMSSRRFSLLQRLQSGLFGLDGPLGPAISIGDGNIRSKSHKRQSMLFNEDDYDYAIELMPDDEYRSVL